MLGTELMKTEAGVRTVKEQTKSQKSKKITVKGFALERGIGHHEEKDGNRLSIHTGQPVFTHCPGVQAGPAGRQHVTGQRPLGPRVYRIGLRRSHNPLDIYFYSSDLVSLENRLTAFFINAINNPLKIFDSYREVMESGKAADYVKKILWGNSQWFLERYFQRGYLK